MPNRRTDDGRRIVHVNVYGYVNGGGRDRNEPRSAPIELADMRGGAPSLPFRSGGGGTLRQVPLGSRDRLRDPSAVGFAGLPSTAPKIH